VPTVAEPVAGRREPAPAREQPGGLGPYQILDELGRGGMGVVYRAYQPALKRTVALKVMTAGRFAAPDARRRFLREAESAAKLRHPYIVPILDLGSEGDQLYFTMAYVPGRTLADLIEAGDLDRDARVALLEKVAGAVAYAHRSGIIHRDLKPSNILVGEDGDPQVTDFGLATIAGTPSSISHSGQVLGTPNYMPPEQTGRGSGRVDERSDVYGLGATLYEAITGGPPFGEGSGAEVLLRVVAGELVPPRRLDRTIPRDLEVICLQAMAREPKRRYASAEALRHDLARWLAGDPIAARPTSWAYRARKRLARHRLAATLGALLLASLLAIGGQALVQWTRARVTWREVFEESFAGPGLGPDLRTVAGRWWLEGGALRGEGSEDAFVEVERDFPGNLRVELEAEVLPGSGKREIGVLLVRRGDGAVGYYLGFGGDHGMAAVDRGEVEVKLTPARPVKAGRRYAVEVTRRGNVLAMAVDGDPVARYVDPMPLNPAEFSRLRLSTFDGSLRVTRLRVLQQRVPELLTATAVGDRLFERGEMAAALDEYARTARDNPDRPVAVEARYKQGLCLLHLGRWEEARAALRRAADGEGEPFYAELARLGLPMSLRLQGRLDEAWQSLVRLEAETREPEARYRLAQELEQLGTAYYTAHAQPSNVRVRRFVTERFPSLPAAESSALILATMVESDEDRRTLPSRVDAFLDRYSRVGKRRAFALELEGVLGIEGGDAARATRAFASLEREYATVNRPFAIAGIYGQGIQQACAGSWDEALATADRLARSHPEVPLAASRARDLRVLVHRLRGEPREALRVIAEAPEASPFAPLERAALLREAGDEAASRAVLVEVAVRPSGPAASLAALLLGREAPGAVEADESIPYLQQQTWLWEEAIRRGDRAAARRHAEQLTDPFLLLHPQLCRALRWQRGLPAG
jgi:predicted Ser/Thr protein kinase/tetratricopeptide (TPR) repeat protein